MLNAEILYGSSFIENPSNICCVPCILHSRQIERLCFAENTIFKNFLKKSVFWKAVSKGIFSAANATSVEAVSMKHSLKNGIFFLKGFSNAKSACRLYANFRIYVNTMKTWLRKNAFLIERLFQKPVFSKNNLCLLLSRWNWHNNLHFLLKEVLPLYL